MSKAVGKVLVTGGSGYVGSHVVLELLDSGFEVVVDNLSYGLQSLIDKRAIFENCDFGNKEQISKVIDKYSIVAVVHLAAYSCIVGSKVDPIVFYQKNVAATLNFLEVLQSKKISNFVFSSTASVFGNVLKEQIPIKENCAKNPINSYGYYKLVVENFLNDIASFYNDFRFVILRYFNACGADLKLRSGECHKNETHIIPLAIQNALGRRKEFQIFGDDFNTFDGTCIRDYIHVSDLGRIHVNAVKYLLDGGESDSFNCGYKHGFSVKQIIDAVEKTTGKNVQFKVVARREGDPEVLIADNTHLINKLKFTPQYDDLDVIIKSAYEWEIKRSAD